MLPNTVSIGLKPQHYENLLAEDVGLNWLEIHPENYMGEGGLPHYYLERIRAKYALSMHGVGMSLGSAQPISKAHLQRLKQLVERYQPDQVSEHISWSHGRDLFYNDLLPLPYNQSSLQALSDNIDRMQTALKRTILIENPSTYLAMGDSDMSEPEFITEVQQRTGCGLLLDVNNVYVSGMNNGFDPSAYFEQYPLDKVGEIHLAGHKVEKVGAKQLLIDDHGSHVCNAVWALYSEVMTRLKPLSDGVPVLIEWDTDIPDFDTLIAEAHRAQALGEPDGVENTPVAFN